MAMVAMKGAKEGGAATQGNHAMIEWCIGVLDESQGWIASYASQGWIASYQEGLHLKQYVTLYSIYYIKCTHIEPHYMLYRIAILNKTNIKFYIFLFDEAGLCGSFPFLSRPKVNCISLATRNLLSFRPLSEQTQNYATQGSK